VELRHLRYFLAVAKNRNFSQAAEDLHVSQPALSQQIRQLEEELGTPLFNRLGRCVTLTTAGKVFDEYAHDALQAIKWGQQQIDELQNLQHGTLRIGVIHTFNTSLIPPIVASFYSSYPAIRISVEEGPTQIIENNLCSGHLDMGVAFHPALTADIEAEPLFEEEFVLVVRKNHPLASKEAVPFKELRDLPLILVNENMATRRMINRFFAEANLKATVHVEASTIEVIMRIIAQSDLASIVPCRTPGLESGLYHTVHLTDPTPTRQAALLYHKQSYRSAATKAFSQFFRDFLTTENPKRDFLHCD
jgi:LysR family cyn operon transcriptional activator